MADQITKILIRKGTKEKKDGIVLDEAELGYTTDDKRVYVGDGVTTGGNIVGNKYFGQKDLPTQLSQVSAAEYGDTVYNTADSTYLVLSGTNPESLDSWLRVNDNFQGTVTRVDAGAGLIFNNADTFITSSGTINLNIDTTSRIVLSKSSNGLLFDYNTFYPITSVLWTSNSTNPTDSNGILEGTGQVWEAGGTVTTSSSNTLYSWIRTG